NDLVTYNHKHNQANGEDNRDGTDANWSWNSGIEGMSTDKQVLENRKLRQRAMAATLFLSFGTPIWRGGDEFLKTQFGNNNAYCQDNVISYMVWEALGGDEINNIRFIKGLIKLRKRMGIFNRRNFFSGSVTDDKQGFKDLAWYTEKGVEFLQNDWFQSNRRALSYVVTAHEKLFMVIMNANANNVSWKLPHFKKSYKWNLLLDTSAKFEAEKLREAPRFGFRRGLFFVLR
ncbi:MAG: glycogen debranching enzyme GlgX, partial [Alphaproteobacteria bacterium]|nr:glycogen debranching enzyme GlgX [Alphaproteobacteria bacterium]